MDELCARCSEYDIIGITESWGSNEITDAELSLPGFQMFREDRGTRGGGVLLYVADKIDAVRLSTLDMLQFRDGVCCLLRAGHLNLFTGVFYRSPVSSHANDEALLSVFKAIGNMQTYDKCLIMGDFNLPNVDFAKFCVHGPSDSFPGKVFDCVLDNFWTQHVTECTRFRDNQIPSCLDWIITDDASILEELSCSEPLGKSDHVCISWQLAFTNGVVAAEQKHNYWKADYLAIRSLLHDIDWQKHFHGKSVDDMWTYFKNVVEECVRRHVPVYVKSGSKNKSPWMTHETKRLISKRKKAWKIYADNRTSALFARYKIARNAVVQSIRRDKGRYQKNLVRQMKKSPKRFYSYVRSKQGNPVTVTRVHDADGSLSSDDKDTARILCDQFQRVFVNDGEHDLLRVVSDCAATTSQLSSYDLFTEEVVLKQLHKLVMSKSPGPDAIHPHFLKNCADLLAAPLTAIYQKSLDDSSLPEDWKTANVIPLYKNGSRLDASNYRPVSLTCVCCKVLESVIRDYLVDSLSASGILTSYQHGFTKGRSCVTNLLVAFETWTKWLDEGFGVDIVYLDYRKAFDSVSHAKLIEKLLLLNVDPSLIKWIAAFLQDRKMRVKVKLEFSDWIVILSGVPQGSVLGPILFLIFINDLPLWIRHSMMLLFADDTKIWRKVVDSRDEALLQQDLEGLSNWTKQWSLQFNVDKCKSMRIAHEGHPDYTLDRVELKEVAEERDLGIVVSNNLKPSLQCARAAQKAMQVLGIIKRNFSINDKEDFRLLFNGYVRPHLEYCVQVWSPYLKKDIECIEKVQRRATKLVKGLYYMTYEERLKALGITTLEKRRIRGDLIQAFRIIKGFDKLNREHFFDFDNCGGYGLRGHHLKLKVHRCRLQLRQEFFSQRVVNWWNKLPSSVIEATSVNTFKIRLDDWMLDVDI